MKRATIYSIATELGISASTVSRAFSRPELVKRSVRYRVLAKAAEVGYRPNRAARGLATGHTGMYGLLVTDITNPFFPPLVRAVQHAAGRFDAEILLIDSGGREAAEIDLVQKVRPQIDGLIAASPLQKLDDLKEMLTGIPSVVINARVEGVPSVVCDNRAALQAAAEHLYWIGHRSFAVLRGPEQSWAASQRAAAVREWAATRDVALEELGPFAAQFIDGRAAASQIVDVGATAVFAFDDLMAAGVVAGLSALGERVPRDRSIIGCDDVLLARTMTPPLATVSAPLTEIGQHAVELLDRVIVGEEAPSVTLHGELVVRGTVAPPSED